MNARSEALANALEEERDRLPEESIFGNKTNFKDYDTAIEYLRTGVKPTNYDDLDITTSCIEDFETICKDYEIE